jgi:CO/xanthine dehydrogenase Mo-binding subunit
MASSTIVAPRPRTGTELFTTDEIRVEGREKVTGAARYAADFNRPNMLWAAFLRSPVPHARIVAIDTAAARALSGVRAVLTGAEIGEHYLGRALLDWPVVALDRVRFIGDTVAVVAAETREIAEAAVAAIEVEYDELPAVFEPADALAEGAPILHEHPERYPFLGKARRPVPHPNVQGHDLVVKGDPDAAFAAATRVFEHHFTTPRHYGAAIEPRATLVWIDDADVAHVVSTNKAPFALRDQLAASTGLPKEKFVVEPAYIGGDFGAKGLSIDEFACYYLARATGRPVKAVRSYLDDLQATNLRHAAEITIRSGVDANGAFTALEVRVVFNGGAYAAGKPIPTLLPGGVPKTPYRFPHARVERTSVYTNTIPGGHVRAPGDIQILFALESHVDMIARELGIDPLEFRRRNAIDAREPDVDGAPYHEPQTLAILDALREAGYGKPLPPGRARGIALAVRHVGGGKTGVRLRAHRSGDVELWTGMVEQGAGALTMIQRVLAAGLGIAPERVRVQRGSTAETPEDPGAGGSRVTHIVGHAALDAGARLREALARVGWDGTEAGWDEAIRALLGGDLTRDFPGTFEGAHDPGAPEWNNFSGCMAEVSVDRATGAPTIHSIVMVADVGTVINPVAHRGQIEGGFAFGLGYAMSEEALIEDGKLVNLSLADYKLPTEPDIPPFRLIELPPTGGQGPFGAKAAGELSTSAVAPAIANAVAAACGARVTTMPLTAERIFSQIA